MIILVDDSPSSSSAQGEELQYLGSGWYHQDGARPLCQSHLTREQATRAHTTALSRSPTARALATLSGPVRRSLEAPLTNLGGTESVSIIGGVKNDRGKFNIYSNGALVATVDQYDANETDGTANQTLYTFQLDTTQAYTIYVQNAGYDDRIGANGYLLLEPSRSRPCVSTETDYLTLTVIAFTLTDNSSFCKAVTILTICYDHAIASSLQPRAYCPCRAPFAPLVS